MKSAMKFTAVLVSLLVVCTSFAGPKKFKMRIAVAPLDWSEHNSWDNVEIPIEFRNAIYEKLVSKLFDTGKFIVLEREAMEALLTEKSIKEENTGQSQKGKIVPAQALVKGKVTDFAYNSRGGGGGVSVGGIHIGGAINEAKVGLNVRMFDVDTSEMIASENAAKSVQGGGVNVGASFGNWATDWAAYEQTPLGKATTKALDECVDKIVDKLGGQPWSCYVADWDDKAKEITLNAGSDLGVEEGDVFDVYRVTKVIKDPETGEILGKKTSKIGTIKVTSVDKKFSIATAIDGSDYQTGDIVKQIKT